MLVGLTGGIGCGKSSAGSYFKRLGWYLIDADEICHSLYETEEIKLLLRDRWGEAVFTDGVPNRIKIADIVFSAKIELEWLNSLFHHRVLNYSNKVIAESENEHVMYEVPLLYEAGWEDGFDHIITVWTDKEVQKNRLLKRGMERKDIETRLKNQMSLDVKLDKSDYGIINNQGFDFLHKQCDRINNQIRN